MNIRLHKVYVILFVFVLLVIFYVLRYSSVHVGYEKIQNGKGTFSFSISNKFKHPKCEVIHVGLVCVGHKNNLYLYTLLKSLLFFRNNPLHIHIMVDKTSRHVLETLFSTWNLSEVAVTFYGIEKFVDLVKWVPNQHYSGIYGMLKLVFPSAISLTITEKIIVVDTDLTFNSDIYNLWKMFDDFNRTTVLGLVENESDFYFNKGTWPALERGYNTGVILYQLGRLKIIDWNKIWGDVTKENLKTFAYVALADQDVMNALIKEYPMIVHKLPCQWNVQLSMFTKSSKCYQNNKIEILHWNSPHKIDVKNKDSEYFRSTFFSFAEFNGNLLKTSLHKCSDFKENIKQKNDSKKAPNIEKGLEEYYELSTREWTTLLFFKEYKYTPQEDDVTLVTHLSYDRLYRIENLASLWNGPISFTFYVTDYELQRILDFMKESPILKARNDISYHVVFKDGEYYPIAELKNIGLKNVNTPYVLVMDIDFVPTSVLYSKLKSYVTSIENINNTALVIPAFEVEKFDDKIPEDKEELTEMLNNGNIFVYQSKKEVPGYITMHYEFWTTTDWLYTVNWEPGFQPYLLMQSNITYDRRFLQFDWSKISYAMQIEAKGYEFIVLPHDFIVHKPHYTHDYVNAFLDDPNYNRYLENVRWEFVNELSTKYNRTLLKVS